MKKFKGKYRIGSNRWQFWDYSAPGVYYITSVARNRDFLFGEIINGRMKLSGSGMILDELFRQIPQWDSRIILDEYIIMPDHFHCLIIIADDDFEYPVKMIRSDNEYVITTYVDVIHELHRRGIEQSKNFKKTHKYPDTPTKQQIIEYRRLRRKMLLFKIIGKLKMQASKQINILNNTPGYNNWQKDFHDRLIRTYQEYKTVKQYIRNNPKNV